MYVLALQKLVNASLLLPWSLQKIEAPVRGNTASDGGPPMSERLGSNDRLFIQEDGAKEKNLLGTGAFLYADTMLTELT